MGAISAGDQILLRDRKDTQFSTERLYGFGMPEMWRGLVNDGGIARGDQTIVADTGVMQGTFIFANLVADLLLFVGTSAGADDKGRRRILSISGTAAAPTFIVDWNDDIDWADGDHLTVVHFFPPWPRYSWFTATGPDFRKDGPPSGEGGAGVDYSDQNEEPPPLVIMGPHYANELTGASLAVQLSAVNSQAVADGASISSYAWTVVPTAGASFDNAAIAAPTITFTVDNSKYWVTCTVTDSNAKTAVGRRAFIIGGAITEFSRGAITENYDNPSVNATLTLTSPETTDSDAIRPVMTWDDFADKTLVVITSEDQYGSTQKTISFRDAAQYEDHLHILYVGYLFAENDDLVDDGSGTVSLNVVSTIPMFLYSISLTGVEDASDWFEMNKELMTVAANLFHLFKYQSTLLEIMDWHLPWSDTVKRSANEEFNEGSLVDRARALAGSRLMAITAIGLGEIWVETDLNLRNNTDRTAETTTLTVTDSDVSGTKRVRVRQYGDNIRALVDGGSSIGLLGSFTPFLSASQFIAIAEGRPQMVNFSRLMLPDQTESNRLAGRIATVANGKFQEVNLELSGNYRGIFSPGDQQKIDLGNTFAGSLQANIRGYTDLEDADVIVRSMSISHVNGFTSVSIVADVMQAEGLTGVTITPPVVPPDAIEPGGNTGSFDTPPPPDFPPVPPNLAVPGAAVAGDTIEGVYFTLDSGAIWEARNTGLSATQKKILGLIFDPWWKTAFRNNSSNPEDVVLWGCGEAAIIKSDDAGKSWEDLIPFFGTPSNDAGDNPAPAITDVIFEKVHATIHDVDNFVLATTWDSGQGGSGGSPIAPSSLANLELHLDAQDASTLFQDAAKTIPATANTDPIGAWEDLSGNGNDVTQAVAGKKPELGLNVIGDQPVVRFLKATSEILTGANVLNADTTLTFFIVIVPREPGRLGLPFQQGVGDFSWERDTGLDDRSFINNTGAAFGPDSVAVGVTEFVTVKASGGNLTTYHRGVAGTPQAFVGNTGATGTEVGGRDTAPALYSSVDIGEIIVYSDALSDANRNGIEQYLYNRWGANSYRGWLVSTADNGQTAVWAQLTINSGGNIRMMDLDIDDEDGTRVYITTWTNELKLNLAQVTRSTLVIANEIDISDVVAEADVNLANIWAVPYCPPFFGTANFGDIVYVYGYWLSSAANIHIIKSTDGGATFGANLGDAAWGTKLVGSFLATTANDFIAIIDNGGGTCNLWTSANGGTNWTDVGKLDDYEVVREAMSLHPDGRLLAGANNAGAPQASYRDTPYGSTATVDATGGVGDELPGDGGGGGGLSSIIWAV